MSTGWEQVWEGHREYMVAKRRKLHDQLDCIGDKQSNIFAGVTIYVNGYTQPNADTLKEIIYSHGGDYLYAPSSRVTHVIATNLPTAKVRQLSVASKVCSPQWIVDSVKEGILLPTEDYELYDVIPKGQTKLGFMPQEKDSIGDDNATIPDSPNKAKDFVSEFYSHSRLHYLSVWSTELREFTNKTLAQTERKIPLLPARDSLRKFSVRAICHIDVDSFFVSVSILNSPHLKGKPVAVTHAKNQSLSKSVPSDSTSDVASCSYEAREFGISNGMSVGRAVQLCPDLQLVPYDFEKYRQVSQILYETIISYSHLVQAVSCDEAFVEFTDYVSSFDEVVTIISRLRQEVEEKTKCTVSAGISHNMLLARLATRKAKPNGQYFLAEDEVKEYLADHPVGKLPGIGYSMKSRLESLGVTTCGQLLEIPLTKLKEEFGTKTGEMLYYFARGIDNRDLSTKKERKSLSVEINYGMRFTHISEVESLLQQLSQELNRRAVEASVEGTAICLKMKVRQPTAPVETSKYLGHGRCDNVSRTSQLLIATNGAEEIGRIACQLLKQLRVDPADVRGMGIHLNRLVPVSKSSPSKGKMTDIRTLLANSPSKKSPSKLLHTKEEASLLQSASPSKSTADELNTSLILDLPPASQLDQSVLLALPSDIQEKVFEGYSKPHDTSSQGHHKTVSMPQFNCLSSSISTTPEIFMSDVRTNIKAWVSLYPSGPSHLSVNQFIEFIQRLLTVNLEMVDLALKCLCRSVTMNDTEEWKDSFARILTAIQFDICSLHRGELAIDNIS